MYSVTYISKKIEQDFWDLTKPAQNAQQKVFASNNSYIIIFLVFFTSHNNTRNKYMEWN